MIDLPVDNPETLEDILVSIFDEDRYGKDESLGKCTIPVQILRTAITSGQTQARPISYAVYSNKLSCKCSSFPSRVTLDLDLRSRF